VIILYANQPLLTVNGRYYSKVKNFVDFLAYLSKLSNDYSIAVPCRPANEEEIVGLPEIDLRCNVIELGYYEGHAKALLKSLLNAPRLGYLIRKHIRCGDSVVLAGPGPNSMLFILSYLIPRKAKLAFFIRGDTVETIKNIYQNRFAGTMVINLVKLFRWRIYRLLNQGRAKVFTYGDILREQYSRHGTEVYSIAPLIDEFMIRRNAGSRISDDQPLKVLFVGRFSEEKGILSLIDACQAAHQDGNPFYLSLIGHGHLENTIRERVQAMGLEKWVPHVGFIPHGKRLMECYDSHDLLCLPSKTEGVPRVIAEALARGLPVLASPVGSIPVEFKNMIKLIRGTDLDSIIEGIRWCDGNRNSLTEMRAQGINYSRQFVIGEHVRRVDQLLRPGMQEA